MNGMPDMPGMPGCLGCRLVLLLPVSSFPRPTSRISDASGWTSPMRTPLPRSGWTSTCPTPARGRSRSSCTCTAVLSPSGTRRDVHDSAVLRGLDHGYAVVSVNYRLSGEAIFPAAVAGRQGGRPLAAGPWPGVRTGCRPDRRRRPIRRWQLAAMLCVTNGLRPCSTIRLWAMPSSPAMSRRRSTVRADGLPQDGRATDRERSGARRSQRGDVAGVQVRGRAHHRGARQGPAGRPDDLRTQGDATHSHPARHRATTRCRCSSPWSSPADRGARRAATASS